MKKERIEVSCIMFMITYIMITNILESYYIKSNLFLSNIRYLMMEAIVLLGIICFFKQLIFKRTDIISISIFLFWMITIISTIINISIQQNIILSFLSLSFWVAIFYIIKNFKGNEERELLISIMQIEFAVLFIVYNYCQINNRVASLNGPAINSVYYLLCCFPFLICSSNKIIKWGGSTVCIMSVIISGKRAAIIAIILVLIIWGIMDIQDNDKRIKSTLKKILFITLFMAILFFIYRKIQVVYGIDVFQMLESLKTDGGSGRTYIYKGVWEAIKKRELISQLFGDGYTSVALKGIAYGSMAHNEFLEFFYDYGLIGFVCYINIWVQLMKRGYKGYLAKKDYTLSYIVSLILVTVLSLFSILIPYPRYFTFIVIFWAIYFNSNVPQYKMEDRNEK